MKVDARAYRTEHLEPTSAKNPLKQYFPHQLNDVAPHT